MTDTGATGGWLRRNVGAVVAWALIVVSAAFSVGITRAEVSTIATQVGELRLESSTARGERTTVASDVRVLEARHVATESTVARLATVLDRLDRAVVRLEALAATRAHP